jgi:hypothetical protein
LLLKSSQRFELAHIQNSHLAILEYKQLALTELPQDSVHMDGAQAEGIGEYVLVERTGELVVSGKSHQVESLGKLKEEVRGALDGGTAPDADEVLDDHGFVP